METKALDKAYIANTYTRLDVEFTSGSGAELFDETGKRYIDLGSGIAVNAFGVADEVWVEAVKKQVGRLQHVSNYYYTQPQVQLAQMLCERTGMRKVFFSNSGAEANECAIKAARKYADDRYPGKRPVIITLVSSFHGRTITTLSATGQEEFHKHFGPFTPGFHHVLANDISDLRRALERNDCCAVMMEMIQGEGGVTVMDADYVQGAAKLCAERDILFIVDEVQTGNGRTGELYAYMHYDITPDIISTAKGLAGGLPMGATLFNEKTQDVLSVGMHGSTFGGNPVSAAGACSIISRIDDALLHDVRSKGAYIMDELKNAPGVLSVTGRGLLLGIAVMGSAKDILTRCLHRGVIVLTAKDKVRLVPPLNIPFDLLKEAIAILKEEIAK